MSGVSDSGNTTQNQKSDSGTVATTSAPPPTSTTLDPKLIAAYACFGVGAFIIVVAIVMIVVFVVVRRRRAEKKRQLKRSLCLDDYKFHGSAYQLPVSTITESTEPTSQPEVPDYNFTGNGYRFPLTTLTDTGSLPQRHPLDDEHPLPVVLSASNLQHTNALSPFPSRSSGEYSATESQAGENDGYVRLHRSSPLAGINAIYNSSGDLSLVSTNAAARKANFNQPSTSALARKPSFNESGIVVPGRNTSFNEPSTSAAARKAGFNEPSNAVPGRSTSFNNPSTSTAVAKAGFIQPSIGVAGRTPSFNDSRLRAPETSGFDRRGSSRQNSAKRQRGNQRHFTGAINEGFIADDIYEQPPNVVIRTPSRLSTSSQQRQRFSLSRSGSSHRSTVLLENASSSDGIYHVSLRHDGSSVTQSSVIVHPT